MKRTVEQTPTQPLANAFHRCKSLSETIVRFDLIRRAYCASPGAETIAPSRRRHAWSTRGGVKIEDAAATAQRLGFVLEKFLRFSMPKSQFGLCRIWYFLPLVPVCALCRPKIKMWRVPQCGRVRTMRLLSPAGGMLHRLSGGRSVAEPVREDLSVVPLDGGCF